MDNKKDSRIAQSRGVSVVTDTSLLLRSESSPFTRIKRQLEQIKANFLVLLSPGEKQFKDLPKRLRLMIVSFIIPVLYAIAKLLIFPSVTAIPIWIGVSAVLGVITYFGMYWGLKGRVNRVSFISVLPLPVVLVIANTLFLSNIFVGEINRLYLWGLFGVAIAFFMCALYVIGLAVNILNVTLFYMIPLSRLGETVAYIAGVVTMFLIGYIGSVGIVPEIVAGNWVLIGVYLLGLFALIAGLTAAFWRYFVPYSGGFWTYCLLVAFFLLLSVAVVALFAPYAWMAGVLESLIAYTVYGFVIHKEQNTLKDSVIVEFSVALFLAFLLVLWV